MHAVEQGGSAAPAGPDECAPGAAVDRDELATTHLYLVQHVVSGLAARYPRHVDRGELWSAGALGLVDASRRYDPDSGIPFARYATIRIRGAMIDSARDRDWASRGLRRTIRGVQTATARFEETEGRTPSSLELAALLGITADQLAEHSAAAKAATLLQLDQTAADAEHGGSTVADTVEERTADWLPDEAFEQRELVGTVRSAVHFLPPVQREVVRRYYFEGDMLRDIAGSLRVTEARVSQIRSEALAAMRGYFGTAFEGVPAVAPGAPGLRRRAAYVATVSSQSTWRSRLDADALGPAAADPTPVALAS